MTHRGPERPGLGVLEALGAASLWGSSGIFSVHLFRQGVSPGAVGLYRPLLALAFLAVVLALFRPRAFRIDRAGLRVLLVAGGLTVGLFQLAYQLSIDAVGVPATVALLFLAPALVVASAGPVLGEWPTRRRVFLAGVVVAGVWLSVLGADRVTPAFGASGVFWGLGAAVGYAGYTLLGRYAARRWGPLQTVLYSTAGGCVILAVAVPLLAAPAAPPDTVPAWGLLAAYALVTITVAQILFYDALTRAEASRVSIAAAAEPVVAAVLATLLLGQGLEPMGWVGLGLVVAGVAGVATDRARS